MVILRPLAQIAADKAREALDIALQGIVDTVTDDYERPVVIEPTVYRACREGKSLYSPSRSRTIYKRKFFGRWSDL